MTKIEVGKTYQTRDGRTAIIDAVDCKFRCGATILGRVVREDNTHCIYTWNADGRYFEGDEHCNDLIIPTERKSYWVNLYANPIFGFATREVADESAGPDRTHVLEIKTEDGEPVEVKLHKVAK